MEKNCLFSVGTLTAGMFFFLDPNLGWFFNKKVSS